MNHGAELLVATGASLAGIAAAAGVSRTAAKSYRDGRKTPGPETAARLEVAYQIPPDAWRQRAGAEPGRAPTLVPPVDRDGAIARVRAQLARIDRMRSADLSPGAAVELERVETAAIRELRYLEGPPPMSEARILSTPQWRRILDAIVGAIRTLPEDWRVPVRVAITDALQELDR